MITQENIFSHEIVGLRAEINDSTNSEIIGLNGTVVDESKSMFTLKTGNKFKNISKKYNTWKFIVDDKEIMLHGGILEKRSFDRLRSKI
jgi:ribonuclease P protein subunit POP4